MSDNILMTTLEEALRWGKGKSLWPFTFGLACCAVEMMAAMDSDFDWARFGADVFRDSPRHSDLMIVSGTVTKKMAPRIRRLYDQMAFPKYVISMGACATAGGPYVRGYSVVDGVDQVVPVDIYVFGCPPRPEALISALKQLQDGIVSGKVKH